MTDPSGDTEDVLNRLASDPFFRSWTDLTNLFSREVIEESISLVLGTTPPGLAPLPGAQERAMARLALYQVVVRHLDEMPMSWADMFGRLSPSEIIEAEELLGTMSLRELFE